MSLSFQAQLNKWGSEKTPFVFLIDFECQKPKCWSLNEPVDDFMYNFNGFTNIISKKQSENSSNATVEIKKYPIESNGKIDCYVVPLDNLNKNILTKTETVV
jgi:hypothetical protein